jgi:hypothetical protein
MNRASDSGLLLGGLPSGTKRLALLEDYDLEEWIAPELRAIAIQKYASSPRRSTQARAGPRDPSEPGEQPLGLNRSHPSVVSSMWPRSTTDGTVTVVGAGDGAVDPPRRAALTSPMATCFGPDAATWGGDELRGER